MNILLLGSGGREHALARLISNSPHCDTLFIAPGNPGTSALGQNIDIQATDIAALGAFAKQNEIGLTIVGPEMPLVLGIVDHFEAEGLPIFGPNKIAAQLEGSKEWSKSLMINAGIPTAKSTIVHSLEDGIAYLNSKNTYPIVLKADGLAAGKGVTIAETFSEAEKALQDCFISKVFKDAGNKVLIEDFLVGEEASILAFTDGNTVIPMVSAQDHKAIYDGDKGPNTGGMGAYSPAPIVTPEVEEKVQKEIFEPLIKQFKKEGIIYKGIIYAGLMIHKNTPSVVEFNARFGDPEAQVVLPRLKTDLISIMLACLNNRLDTVSIDWSDKHTVCVVLASKGYPGNYEKGVPILGTQDAPNTDQQHIIHAGTAIKDKQLVTAGGRVLGVVGSGDTLSNAITQTYDAVTQIAFDTKIYRQDIGFKAMASPQH